MSLISVSYLQNDFTDYFYVSSFPIAETAKTFLLQENNNIFLVFDALIKYIYNNAENCVTIVTSSFRIFRIEFSI